MVALPCCACIDCKKATWDDSEKSKEVTEFYEFEILYYYKKDAIQVMVEVTIISKSVLLMTGFKGCSFKYRS